MPPFLLDANFFITAHRTTYPLDVFPSFWGKVKELAVSGQIGSIDKVKKEIYENDDELKDWCEENLPKDFFNESGLALAEYAQVVNWAYAKLDSPYSQAALNVFMDADEADAFLVAFAIKHNLVVVTNEVSAPDGKRNVKLPDACLAFQVRHVPPVQLFRELGKTV